MAIRTMDTDVVILAVLVLTSIDISGTWIAFGTWKACRYMWPTQLHYISVSEPRLNVDTLTFNTVLPSPLEWGWKSTEQGVVSILDKSARTTKGFQLSHTL